MSTRAEGPISLIVSELGAPTHNRKYFGPIMTIERLRDLEGVLSATGGRTELYALPCAEAPESSAAAVLVLRGGVDYLLGPGSTPALRNELRALRWDKQMSVCGRLAARKKHYVAEIGETAREAALDQNISSITPLSEVPTVRAFLAQLSIGLGSNGFNLSARAINYFDADPNSPVNYAIDPHVHVPATGIKYHGEAQDRFKIVARLGAANMPLNIGWFRGDQPISDITRIQLNEGDMYILSDVAMGRDHAKRSAAAVKYAVGPKFSEVKRASVAAPLDSKTVSELRCDCKKYEIRGYSSMKKAELVAAIEDFLVNLRE